MIEPIMYIGIGFLVAGFWSSGSSRLVHARAERLTMRRMEALTPLSMAEIQADKDQLRAEFAMSTRRLEMSVEQLKAKTTTSSRKSARRATRSVGSSSSSARRPRLCWPRGQGRAARATSSADNAQATWRQERHLGRRLSARSPAAGRPRQAAAKLSGQIGDRRQPARRTVALRAQAEALKGQIESYEQRDA